MTGYERGKKRLESEASKIDGVDEKTDEAQTFKS